MNTDKKQLTELKELGEFELINKLTSKFLHKNNSTIKSIGDDAAIIDNQNFETVVSTDILVEGIHFDLMYTALKYIGYKSVVVNLSDIYAMNAVPKQITVSIAVSNRFSVEAIQELYEGIYEACKFYNVDLVGGDTSSSKKGMFISVTAIGQVEKNRAVYRNSAQNNDLICVSGNLGAAYIGLQLLEREKLIFQQTKSEFMPDFKGNEYVLQRQLRPEARKDIIELFNEKKIQPTSMIDISDGLSSEIIHICSQSNKGCEIYEEKLPVDIRTEKVCMEFNLDPTIAAMSGGEDYELLFTVSIGEYEKIKKLEEISIIGHITEAKNGLNLIAKNGTPVPIIAQGWNTMKEK